MSFSYKWKKNQVCDNQSDSAAAKALQCVLHWAFLNRHLILVQNHIWGGGWIFPVSTDHVVYGFHITIPHRFFLVQLYCTKELPSLSLSCIQQLKHIATAPLKILVEILSALVETMFYFNSLELYLHEKMGDGL